jgi:hypothetical protein
MVVSIDAGNFDVVVGTANEIAEAIKGKSKSNILGFTHNGTNYCLILARG